MKKKNLRSYLITVLLNSFKSQFLRIIFLIYFMIFYKICYIVKLESILLHFIRDTKSRTVRSTCRSGALHWVCGDWASQLARGVEMDNTLSRFFLCDDGWVCPYPIFNHFTYMVLFYRNCDHNWKILFKSFTIVTFLIHFN